MTKGNAMAKGKGKGGNLGLIVTLVIFVLTTVILGVTTYMGFSQIEEKEVARKKAEDAAKQMDADSKYFRMLYRSARMYLGKPVAGLDLGELSRDKGQFQQGQFAAANNQKDKEESINWMKDMDARYAWTNAAAQTAPEKSAEVLVTEREARITDLLGKLKKAVAAKDAADVAAKEETEALKKQIEASNKALVDFKAKVSVDLKKELVDVQKLNDAIKQKADEAINLRNQLKAEEDKAAALQKQLTTETLARSNAQKAQTKALEDREDSKRTLDAVLTRTNFDLSQLNSQELTGTGREKLKNWKKRWEIVKMDPKATDRVYVNLGSDDKAKAQLSFSLHAMTPDGRLNPSSKGTLELVRVIGPHLSLARVTSTNDAAKDPLLVGDRLFNPAWDPDRKTRVAIAGLVDMDRERTDTTAKFVKALERFNVQVDAWIDVSDDKAPKLRETGGGMGIDTEYLIVGYDMIALGLPKSKDAIYNNAFRDAKKKLDTDATNYAIKRVRAEDFMELMGINPRKVK
jgi:hypothetical protein